MRFRWTRTRAERKRHDIPVHVEIDVLEKVVFTVLVKQHLVSRSSSSCGSERAGHSTASSRSPGFCRCATRVFRSTLLWRQLEAWQVGSALHAIRRQGGPKVCPTNGPPLPSSACRHRLFLLGSSFFLSSSFFPPFFLPFFPLTTYTSPCLSSASVLSSFLLALSLFHFVAVSTAWLSSCTGRYLLGSRNSLYVSQLPFRLPSAPFVLVFPCYRYSCLVFLSFLLLQSCTTSYLPSPSLAGGSFSLRANIVYLPPVTLCNSPRK